MLLKLVDSILEVEQLRAGVLPIKCETLDLEDVIDRVVRCFAFQAAARGMTLDVDITTTIPRIHADPLRLEQILNNLVGNALKYCPSGSQIVIGAKAHHSQIALWVADNGPGSTAEQKKRIFQEFATGASPAAANERSHGLGLAITKRLAEAHGGLIRVDSEPGEGATFTVLLPIDRMQ